MYAWWFLNAMKSYKEVVSAVGVPFLQIILLVLFVKLFSDTFYNYYLWSSQLSGAYEAGQHCGELVYQNNSYDY